MALYDYGLMPSNRWSWWQWVASLKYYDNVFLLALIDHQDWQILTRVKSGLWLVNPGHMTQYWAVIGQLLMTQVIEMLHLQPLTIFALICISQPHRHINSSTVWSLNKILISQLLYTLHVHPWSGNLCLCPCCFNHCLLCLFIIY